MNKHKTTKKGYLRYAKDADGRIRFEHNIVWEEHNGAIPPGMQIHHIDHDKTNNDISNLMIVSPLEHKRYHQGCKLVDGEWYKPCKVCGEFKKCDKENWYYSRGWINGRLCKACYIEKQVIERKEREKKGWKRKEYRRPVNENRT